LSNVQDLFYFLQGKLKFVTVGSVHSNFVLHSPDFIAISNISLNKGFSSKLAV